MRLLCPRLSLALLAVLSLPTHAQTAPPGAPAPLPSGVDRRFALEGASHIIDEQIASAQTPAFKPYAVLPDGVDRLFASEGDNTLLAYATPGGYAELRDLVRHLDGQLAVLRVEASLAEIAPADARALNMAPGATAFSSAQSLRLREMQRAGRLRLRDTVRVTTLEDTPFETVLGGKVVGVVALNAVPRLNPNGTLSVEMSAPVARYVTAASGESAFLPLSMQPDGTVRLLVVTQALGTH